MKKLIIYFLLLIILISGIFILAGCNSNDSDKEISEKKEITMKKMTAEDILKEIKEKNTNIGDYIVYTEENDSNNLLGRPNQYTSKVTFEDIRLEQFDKDSDDYEPVGGTIEVFNNSKDMQKRKDYIESITSSISAFAEYSYSNDYVLLRLNSELTPSQAREYENIFNEILK